MGSVAGVPLNLILMKRVGDGGYRKKKSLEPAITPSQTFLNIFLPLTSKYKKNEGSVLPERPSGSQRGCEME